MAKFIRHVPGFRSNKLWKKIVAVTYYVLFGLALATSGGVPTTFDVIMNIVRFVVLFGSVALPIITWTSKRKWLPWARRRLWARLTNTAAYLFAALIAFGLLVSVNSPQEAAILAKQQAAQAKAAKLAQERRAATAAAQKAAAQKAAAQKAAAQKAAAQKAAAQKAAAQKKKSDSTTTSPNSTGVIQHVYRQFTQQTTTQFMQAVYGNNEQSVLTYLKAGMNPNVGQNVNALPTSDGLLQIMDNEPYDGVVPVLTYATEAHYSKIVQDLLNYGADPNVPIDGMSPLLLATRNGFTGEVNALLKAGANPNVRDKHYQDTPLAESVSGPHRSVSETEALLAGKANPNLRSANDQTPLMLVADTSIPRGINAWFNSTQKDVNRITQDLLKSGAKVNERDGNGTTALMDAAASGDSDVVKTLLAAGADPNIQDNNGETAQGYAQNNGYNSVATMLLNASLKQ